MSQPFKSFSIRTKIVSPRAGWFFIYFRSDKVCTRSKIAINGTINGHLFATTAIPWAKNFHQITVNAAMRAKMGIDTGQEISLLIRPQVVGAKKTPVLPGALRRFLETKPTQLKQFKDLAPYKQRNFIAWVNEAKQEQTRMRRINSIPERIRRNNIPNT
jgi:hypothetical protein